MADNTFVNIGGHKVSAGIKYSASEVKTGDVWTDGKPIYRRVVQGQLVTSGSYKTYSINISSWGLDYIVKVDYTLKQNGGGTNNLVFGGTYYSTTVFSSCYYTTNNTTLTFQYGSGYAVGDTVTGIVYYTKTTD